MWIFSVFFIFLKLSMSSSGETDCDFLKESFTNSSSEFIACAINNSRPVTLCESCVQYYLDILYSYENMTKFVENDTRCVDRFINLDRLQIVQTLYLNSVNLWNEAKCEECFQVTSSTLSPIKSDKAKTFQECFDNFTACVNKTGINDTELCPTCINDYIKLDEYYHSISNENEKIATCMDMVDLMNTTRSFWSQRCCKYRRHHEFIFLGSTVAVLVLTLCFYVIAQFCTVKKNPTILQQRRFAESFNQTSHEDDRQERYSY